MATVKPASMEATVEAAPVDPALEAPPAATSPGREAMAAQLRAVQEQQASLLGQVAQMQSMAQMVMGTPRMGYTPTMVQLPAHQSTSLQPWPATQYGNMPSFASPAPSFMMHQPSWTPVAVQQSAGHPVQQSARQGIPFQFTPM